MKGGGKAQVAMEFLMTYGWAILIVVVILAALFFLGVLSPNTPNSCLISAPFICNDIVFREGGFEIILKAVNILNGDIADIKVNEQSCNTTLVNGIQNGQPGSEIKEGINIIRCYGANIKEKENVKTEVSINYNSKFGLQHNIKLNGNGKVEKSNYTDNFNISNMPNLSFGGYGNFLVLNMTFAINYTDVKDYSGYNNNGTISGALWQRYLNEDNNSLVLLMPFDEDNSTTAIDKSDYKNNGVLSGATLNTSCITGNCYTFDGVNDFIRILNKPSFSNFGNRSFSYGAWFKANTFGSGTYVIDESSSSGYYELVTNVDDKVRVQLADVLFNAVDFTSPLTYNDNNWHHAFVNVDRANNNVSLYVDGVNVNSRVASTLTNDVFPNSNLRIGSYQETSFFNGNIDNVRIYNKALTSSEILDHYEKYKLYYSPSFKFDGVNDHIEIPNSVSLNKTNQLTVEAWIKHENNLRGDFVSKANNTPVLIRQWILFKDATNRLAFTWSSDGSSANADVVTSNSLVNNGTWTHVVSTFDSGVARIYINGTLDNSRTSTITSIHGNISAVRIGHSVWGGFRFNGSIANVRIYNRSLSANQIYELYNSYR